MFNELTNSNHVDWSIDTQDFKFFKLKDLDASKTYIVRGCFITPDAGYGVGAVIILDDKLVNLPARYVELVKKILSNPEMIAAIKSGKCGMKVSSFTSKYGRVGYSIDLFDIK